MLVGNWYFPSRDRNSHCPMKTVKNGLFRNLFVNVLFSKSPFGRYESGIISHRFRWGYYCFQDILLLMSIHIFTVWRTPYRFHRKIHQLFVSMTIYTQLTPGNGAFRHTFTQNLLITCLHQSFKQLFCMWLEQITSTPFLTNPMRLPRKNVRMTWFKRYFLI